MPEEEGHNNSQIGSGDDADVSARPRRSGSPINPPVTANTPARSRAGTAGGDAGFNLVGFNVPLPEPVRGVRNEAQAAFRKLDTRLGGTRLDIDPYTPTFAASKGTQGTKAIATAPGPPMTDENDNDGDEDNNDIEMRERQQAEAETHDEKKGTAGNSIDDDNPFFAVPGGPGIRAKRGRGVEGDPNAFFHPASKEPQRVIWLPADKLGLCAAEVEKNRELGIESSSRHAWLVGDSKVRVSGRPPDW
jgi:hypothetical protein